jgi:hypothetical protein
LLNGTSNHVGQQQSQPQYVETGQDGVASVVWQYPSDGSICTVNASVKSSDSILNWTLAIQPVTLTVGNETQLLLQAWRDPSGIGHTICAQLVNGSGYPLSSQNVTLTVNGTAYALPPTNGRGYVTLHLALQPGDTSANMYEVMATFNGTNPRSFSINGTDPYGDQYAMCTTNQYDLRPSTNSSTLAVLLQTTDAITASKTMEQIQNEAEDSGTLRVRDQWTWLYPWFRVHFQFVPNGTVEYDDGISPLPFGNTLEYTAFMNNTVVNFVVNANLAILSAIVLSQFQGYVISMLGPAGFLAALTISLTAKWAALTVNWNSIGGLGSILAGSIVSTGVGIMTCLGSIIEVVKETIGLAEVGFGTLYSMLSVPINIAFWILILNRLSELGAGVQF